jgi:hypothetical protein
MSENWKIQVSPKLPDGTLINIRAESADELTALLNYAQNNAQLITDTAALLNGARNAAGVTQPQSQQQPPVQPPAQSGGWGGQQQAQQPAAPAGNGGPVCEHGAYVWKDFVSKKGNAVKGFFCPAPNTQCKPDFRK